MANYLTVKEFIGDIRARLGDTSCEIPERNVIAWLNLVLPRLAREPGLDKLFKYNDTYELASINTDGSNSASWKMNGVDTGEIIDIKSIRILDSSSCNLTDVSPCYVPYEDFFICNPAPEQNEPGSPSQFTINYMGGDTRIIFDRPINAPHMLDMVYTAFHPRIKTDNDYIKVSLGFIDVLNEYVTIMYMQESADFATARALTEDYDHLVDQAREHLAKRYSGLPFRTLRRSF